MHGAVIGNIVGSVHDFNDYLGKGFAPFFRARLHHRRHRVHACRGRRAGR
jgi:hypothetical protein